MNAWSATVTWDGGGGNFSWQTAANWSGDALPGSADDVVINVAGDVTINSGASVTIRSLQCSNSLTVAGGIFRVTGGASVVQGRLSTTNNVTLSATGAGTTFTGTGAANVNGAGFEATGGARMSLPGLAAYSKGSACNLTSWRATGAGSALEFSGLASMAGGSCITLEVEALSGGRVSLARATNLNEGLVTFHANGTNSLVDLSALAENFATARTVSFEARSSGLVSMPQFPGGRSVRVTLESGGAVSVAQLRQLNGFTVTGSGVDFTALTNLTAGNVTVRGGAVVTAPNLTVHHHGTACEADTWEVNGAGSVLDLSSLASLTGPTCGYLNLEATAGGTLVLSNLPVIADGTLNFRATGTNSLVDLAALQESPTATRTLSFEARSGGTVSMLQFPGGPTVQVTLESGGVLATAQLRRLNGFTVSGMTVDFPALTNLASGSVLVSGGAVVTAPNLTLHHHGTACESDRWEVSGPGSVLNFSSLTSLTGPTCGYLNLEATAGGTLVLSNLPVIADGVLSFQATGTNSLLDLRALQESPAVTRTLSFEARSGGTIWMPQFPGGPTVQVTLESGGVLPAAQLRRLNGFTVTRMAVDFLALTNLAPGNILVSSGAVVTVPSLVSHANGTTCFVNTWEVRGAGSLLDLSPLTNLTGGACAELAVQALAGGTVNLSNLVTISEGRVSFLADGATSRVDLGSLVASLATVRPVSLEVRNAGAIVAPQMTGGSTVGVTIRSHGVMSVGAMTRLGSITVSAAAVDFTALTNFDGGTLIATNGAAVAAPLLRTYAQGNDCVPDTWLVRDPGSVADLSGLAQLTGGTCAWLDAQALNGGHLLLGNLRQIPSGRAYFLASGGGSLIDLHSLSNFLNAASLSKLTATNGGTILLPAPAFFSGVTLAIAAGTPGLASASLEGTNLVLHGRPWQSYWVEARDTTASTNPWTFFRVVPLTNDVQPIAPRAAANREFRAWEFVADPFLLELSRLGPNPQLVLYAPTNRTLDVQVATNLAPVVTWSNLATVTMTNTFRIFPPEPATAPERYFKATTR